MCVIFKQMLHLFWRPQLNGSNICTANYSRWYCSCCITVMLEFMYSIVLNIQYYNEMHISQVLIQITCRIAESDFYVFLQVRNSCFWYVNNASSRQTLPTVFFLNSIHMCTLHTLLLYGTYIHIPVC